ncbi:hypothetical protein [Curtobacterium sp. MCJR17_020]|uniref:hypothetical protein n=1 Tax=Curtobacterium sp. MCJR17_020 TaxID=2175619 RepID=UPI000DAA131F|nr:hypothetical protein [Curtobacterium sp. MCJR17_020]WIE70754.1 hypothetical protein DEJ14_011090 [Curtobacterium sp. MCJR17_020]
MVSAVTVMQFVPDDPGTRSPTSNIAAPRSSSVSATAPVRQLFAALSVVSENAAYEAVAMSAPLATTARGKAIQAAVRPWREVMCMAVLSVGITRRVI